MKRPPPLASGKALLLYPFSEAEIGAEYIGWLNDPEVVRFSNQRHRRHDKESCLAYLRAFSGSDNLFLGIRLVADGRLIGTMTAYVARHHGTADMGLLIGDRSLWGRGLGLEAWNLLMHHLFQARKLRKITGGAVRCNAGMVKIMERSGMHLEATRAQQEIVAGELQDVLYFAKFRSD